MDVLDGLNDNQRKAAEAGEGPVLIVAGPGTGKTKTLAARIVHLMASRKAQPQQILALTFTKKAAQEMRVRVAQLHSGPDSKSPTRARGSDPVISTFHALCHDLLGTTTPFVAEAQRLQIIKSLSRPKELKGLSARELGLMISLAKNQPKIDDPVLAKVVRAYNKALADQKVQDFDDLLLQTYQLLCTDQAFCTEAQQRYRYILVDEFQDTNALQYQLLRLLAGNDNIFVIGDPNQSIYGFRGASGTIFQQFRADYPNVLEITLTINYRSVPQIVQLSNSVFVDAPQLIAHSDVAGSVRAVQVLNEYGEATWVLNEIQHAIGGGDMLRAVSDDVRASHRRLSDFAVLYRSRSAAQIFQKMVAESGLPYQVVGDGSPYDLPQVQAIIALLRTAVHHQPITLEGFGSAERRFLEQELAKASVAVPHALVEKIAGILGFEPSHDLQQLSSTLVRFKDVASAVQYFDDIAQQGFYDPAADAITLLTIHAAKGLEFPHVFLIGAEEGILPSARGDEAEERRLLYVAVTRARERLEILHAKNRAGQKTEVSRFITALPASALKHHIDPDMDAQVRRIAKRAAKRSQQSLF